MSTNAVAGHSAVSVGPPPSSLYVGDLHPEVTESMLYEKFSKAGMVLSIRVCRDAVTRSSLGYAYVNFHDRADAEKALETMNFDTMLGKSIRIMWSQRDPSARRSGSGNVFIKNLSKHIDTKSMYDTFTMFGKILSCKVACDLNGDSKGYGFIHFETQEAALKAIEKVNGMLLEGKAVYVAKFLPRVARLRRYGDVANRFNNVYVKNFENKLDDSGLRKLFEKFGPVSSCMVMYEDDGVSKGFGFVCFEKFEDAEKAVGEMNGFELPGTQLKLTVCRVMKKCERLEELKRQSDAYKKEHLQRFHGVNLYVKNLDDTVTEDLLRETFSAFGPITSTKLMLDNNKRSRGFGFVCFEKPEDATKAVVEMNNKMIGTKPLYVALAQRKEDRRSQLATQYMQRMALFRMQQSAPAVSGSVYTPASGGYFMQTTLQNPRPTGFAQPQSTIYGSQIRNPAVRYPASNGGHIQMQNGYGSGVQNRFQRPSIGPISRQPRMAQDQHPRNAPAIQPRSVPYQPRVTVETLATAKPAERKEFLGNQLYPLIESICIGVPKEKVQKITGMILDIDPAEVLAILEDHVMLESKVNEAMDVLNKASETSA